MEIKQSNLFSQGKFLGSSNVLNKFISPKKASVEDYERALCYLFKELGREETLNMPLPTFMKYINFLNETAQKNKK